MESIFDRLRNHSKYVDKAINKIAADLNHLNTIELSATALDDLLHLPFEKDLDELIAQVTEQNQELETLKEESENNLILMANKLAIVGHAYTSILDSNETESQPNSTENSVQMIDESIEEIDEKSYEEINEIDPVQEIENNKLNSSFSHIYEYLQELKLKEQEEEDV